MSDWKFHGLGRGMILLACLVLLAAGCNDDDPTEVNNDTTPDEFDQQTALAQAQLAVPQGVALIESITGLAQGVGDKSWAYAEEAQRWEFQESWSEEGMQVDLFYTVQYLDAEGVAQMFAVGSETARHTMRGAADWDYSENGNSFTLDYAHWFDTTISGLDSQTLLVSGTGGFDLDMTYSGTNGSGDFMYVLDWETLGAGVIVPVEGCPTGTIRYNLDPFHLDLIFDGSDTAEAVFYDGAGRVVDGGGGVHTLDCGAE